MHVVVLRLEPDAGSPPVEPATVLDALWASATPEHGVEHMLARRDPDSGGTIDLVVFHRSGAVSDPEFALDLCRRAFTASPLLAGWQACYRSDEETGILWMLTLGDGY
ncbi:MAG: hypothetical protein HOV66_11045 [Streptomycetaceae bacterium]|nr:hypothetical protein [Streptomycetaceae bacterium]